MVAMLIFGYGPRPPHDHGEAAPATCRNCRNPVWFHYVTQRSMVSLFFVPLVPVRTEALLLCPTCAFRRVLEGRERQMASAMVQATADFRAGRLAPDDYHRYLEEFWDTVDGTRAPSDGHPSSQGGRSQPPAAPPAPTDHPSGPPGGAPDPVAERWAPAPDPGSRQPGPDPGWYPDPFGEARERYWDGERWTQGTNPPRI
jgi:hypothetical protein